MERSPDELAERLGAVQRRIRSAAARAGRRPDEVRLVAVTKGVAPQQIRQAMALGLTEFGESRIQEALPKIALLGAGPRWHFVGHLQRNKVRPAADAFALIHAVDSVALGEAIARRARGRAVPVLLQVNVAGDSRKYGFAVSEVPAAAARLAERPGLQVRGLMTIAPLGTDPEAARPVFRRLRDLRDTLRAEWPALAELSMGMTDDFEVAIEEGATLVRVGRALFGHRPDAGGDRGPGSGEHDTREGRGEQGG